MVVAIGGASCTSLSRALMSCIQKPTYGFNAKGLDSQAAEPRFPAPISGKDIRTVAKVGRDERLLDLIASICGFGHTKTRVIKRGVMFPVIVPGYATCLRARVRASWSLIISAPNFQWSPAAAESRSRVGGYAEASWPGRQ